MILSEHFKSMNSEQRKSQAKQNKQNSENSKDKSPSKEETKKAFNKQENFLKGNINKKALSKKDNNKIEAINKSSIKETKTSAIDKNGVKRTNRKVHVIDGINESLIKSNLYGVFSISNFTQRDNINMGINLGKKLLRKLQITNEQVTLASKRLKYGKIDTKRIYAADFENDIFYKIDTYIYIVTLRKI